MVDLLSQRQLQGLKQYKYKAGGYTILDELHNPVWNRLVDRLPMWLAPNLITLIASSCIFLAYALNVYYLPGFEGDAPWWAYVLTALSVAAYVNLDCMDGKQARRTGSSSPLGQLFDHGCDALVLHLMLGNIAASLSVPCSLKMAAGCMGILAPWILAQWEEYHTGIMMYGTRYYGVIEANYSICVVHLLSAVAGPGMWRTSVPLPLAVHAWLGTHTSIADISLLVVGSAGIAQGFENVSRVLLTKSPESAMPADEVGDKHLGRRAALGHLAGLLSVLALGSVLLHQTEGQSALQARLAFLTFGLAYALMASQLIVAHMCKGPLDLPWLPAALLTAAVAANAALQGVRTPGTAVSPEQAAAAVAAVTLACYLFYVLSVVGQISRFLGIPVLRISPQVLQQQQQRQQQQQQEAVSAGVEATPAASLGSSGASPTSPTASASYTASDDDMPDAKSVIPSVGDKITLLDGKAQGAGGLVKRSVQGTQ